MGKWVTNGQANAPTFNKAQTRPNLEVNREDERRAEVGSKTLIQCPSLLYADPQQNLFSLISMVQCVRVT